MNILKNWPRDSSFRRVPGSVVRMVREFVGGEQQTEIRVDLLRRWNDFQFFDDVHNGVHGTLCRLRRLATDAHKLYEFRLKNQKVMFLKL